MKFIDVSGEKVSTTEAASLVKMLCEDAKQIAGVFHGENRSEKFRQNWPDEYKFADANWKTFVDAARQMYAERLGDQKTPPEDARKMHLALVLQAQMSKGQETDSRLQLRPGTQQFEGDRAENQKIIENYGLTKNLRAHLMNSVASRH